MIRSALAGLVLIASAFSASAQERVTVGMVPLAANGELFLAIAQGYFKDEGLDVALRAYPSGPPVAQALAGGAVDFGLTMFNATAFTLAGQGAIRAIAAQARERRGFEGNEVIASNAAYDPGLRDCGDAILPSQYARDLLTASQAKLIGWYSDLDEQQLGALFTTPGMIATRRATVEKFVRAYRRGVTDYAAALLRRDRFGKRLSDAKAKSAAAIIARYVYPGASDGAAAVEAGAYFIDPRARIDIGDIARQIAWYKAQGVIDGEVDAGQAVGLSFTAGP